MGSLSHMLERELDCLLNPQQKTQRQSSFFGDQPKIQKVPPYLRERPESEKFYIPKVASMGPIHHPKGEEYKKIWASKYMQDNAGQQQEHDYAKQLLGKIRSQIKELRNLYNEDVLFGQGFNFNDDKLAWALFLDGCAALHVMHKAVMEPSKLQALDIIVQQDLLLLENQLPYKVLKILSNEDDDSALRNLISKFINIGFIEPRGIVPETQVMINQPAHLLDVLITFMTKKQQTTIDTNSSSSSQHENSKKEQSKTPTHRNIQELRTSGIKIRKRDRLSLTSISFSGSTIYIPPLTVDDFTVQAFMNMIAYEMCPDFKSKYEISNYICFLNSLIDHADDVKLLRKAGVINNYLGSDEEMAQIFNTVSTDFVIDTGIYNELRGNIQHVYAYTARIWFTELRRKHFDTPWTIIGLISAILGFILTIASLKKELGSKK